MTIKFDLSAADPSWHPCLKKALQAVDPSYLQKLADTPDWLPGRDKIFNAFALPLHQVNYILLGESPYPRAQSANGYAFWDAAVTDLWSSTGLSKPVNRATSLRNILKMLLVAEGLLTPGQTGQADIAHIRKQHLIQTNHELFTHLVQKGFLLLNASLVLQTTPVRLDARAWRPFLKEVLNFLLKERPNVSLILLGNIANEIDPLITQTAVNKLYAEHPYNISFIHNAEVLDFFRPLKLLKK